MKTQFIFGNKMAKKVNKLYLNRYRSKCAIIHLLTHHDLMTDFWQNRQHFHRISVGSFFHLKTNLLRIDRTERSERAIWILGLKMAEPLWNWESKVERLRQILEKQALERTYDVSESASARSTDFFSVDNISVVRDWVFYFALHSISCVFISFIVELQCAESLNSSGITTVSDEQLINLVNYNDFHSFSLSPKKSSEGSMQALRQMTSSTPSLPSLPSPSMTPPMSMPLPPTPPPTLSPSTSTSATATINSIALNPKANENIKQSLTKHDVACNTSRTSIENSSRDLGTFQESISWIPMLEMAKSDFVGLIDSHINAIREKAEQTQSKQYEWLQALQMTQTRKIIARKSCVRRIRDEFTTKMITFQNLLDQLENIWKGRGSQKNEVVNFTVKLAVLKIAKLCSHCHTFWTGNHSLINQFWINFDLKFFFMRVLTFWMEIFFCSPN